MKGHDVVLLIAALTYCVNGALYPVLPLYMLSVGGDPGLVGLLVALPFLAAVPMSFMWGAISDRLGDRRHVVAAGGIAGGLLFLALPFAGPVQLVALRSMQVSLLSSSVLLNAVMTEYFPGRKGRSIGNLNLVAGVGAAAGALAVGLLFRTNALGPCSFTTMMLFTACASLTVMASAFALWLPLPPGGRRKATSWVAAVAAFPRRFWPVWLVTLFLPLAGYTVFAVFPLHLANISPTGQGAFVAGLFTALSSASGIGGAWLAGRASDRYGRRRVLVGSGVGYVVVWLAMASTTNLSILAILWAVPAWSFFIVSTTAMTSDLTKVHERGRGVGLHGSALNLGAASGSLFSGYIMVSIGIVHLFQIAGLIAAVGTVLALFTSETMVRGSAEGTKP